MSETVRVAQCRDCHYTNTITDKESFNHAMDHQEKQDHVVVMEKVPGGGNL